jgi:hypothetical protein
MRAVILIVLFLMLAFYVLDHSFFVMRTGVVLVGLAAVGCLCYMLLWGII